VGQEGSEGLSAGRDAARAQRGVALLTVLAVLTLLVIFATAFIQTVRLEVQTTDNFVNTVAVSDVAAVGNEVSRQDLLGTVLGGDGVSRTGDEIRPYLSRIDSWAIGRAEVLSPEFPRSVYDLRQWIFDPGQFANPQLSQNDLIPIHNGAVWQAVPWAGINVPARGSIARRGIDEDPEGNFLGGAGSGLTGVDDDLDGVADEESVNDDDEDGVVDEDPIELRGAVVRDSFPNPRLDSLPLGYDNDGDFNGIEPSTSRLNLSIAGNLNRSNSRHSYHQGSHPSELDLEAFLTVMLGQNVGVPLAATIVQFRRGIDTGAGFVGADDNGNSNPDNMVQISGDPQNATGTVLGNGVDDDGDGLTDEEDEIFPYFQENTTGFPADPTGNTLVTVAAYPSDLSDNRADRASILTNGEDNGGIPGVADDIFEIDDLQGGVNPGIDELAELEPRRPFGDDSFPRNRLNLRLIPGMDESPDSSNYFAYNLPNGQQVTPFELIENYVTVESTVDRYAQETPQDRFGNRRKLNPNLFLIQNPEATRQTVQHLLPLAGIDNDGDWGSNVVQPGGAIIKDDRNKNHIPDGDWDSDAEVTSGPPAPLGKGNGVDEDLDGEPDDTGDDNGDTLVDYDPEYHVNEDRPSYSPLTAEEIAYATGDEDPDGPADVYPDTYQEFIDDYLGNDGIDNNGNRTRWMSDGIDNDGDGLIDEAAFRDAEGKDEGVDEPGEWYFESWDNDPYLDAGGGVVNDPDTYLQGEVAEIYPAGNLLPSQPFRRLYKMEEDPVDLPLVANLADAIDYTSDPDLHDPATKLEIRDATAGFVTRAIGNEAVRITEVLARPVIRIQAEDPDVVFNGGGTWEKPTDNRLESVGKHYYTSDGNGTSTWTFTGLPEGKFLVLLYSWGRFEEDPDNTANELQYTVGRTSVITLDSPTAGSVTLTSATPIALINSASDEQLFPTSAFTSAFLNASSPRVAYSQEYVELAAGEDLEIEIQANGDNDVSFDYMELYAPDAQYVEICNFGERPVDLLGWEFRTVINTPNEEGKTLYTQIGGDLGDHILAPGQFAVMYRGQTNGDIPELDPADYSPTPVALTPLRFGPNDLIAAGRDGEADGTGTTPLDLTGSLQEILFSWDSARTVELWAPKDRNVASADIDMGDVTPEVLIDSFDYHPSLDFGSPFDVFKRQDTAAFAPEHRGDPTRSVLRADLIVNGSVEEIAESYVHGPMRFLAEDAVVTLDDPDASLQPSDVEDGKYFKPVAFRGRTFGVDVSSATHVVFASETNRTEYGETLFEISEAVANRLKDDFGAPISDASGVVYTFHWPGILNHFRNPDSSLTGIDEYLPKLYVRAGGISGATIGYVDLDPSSSDEDRRLVFSGDLLYIIDPVDLEANPSDYEEIIDTGQDPTSLRISIQLPFNPKNDTEKQVGVFGYIEIVAADKDTNDYLGCDPGLEHYFYPDQPVVSGFGSRFFYMERRRIDESGGDELLFQRSLRFREGPLANCSPYMPSANGRNIEKYSMGRGVFSGPTAQEMSQIATRMEFLPRLQADGLLNINCADQKVLTALPFYPPGTGGFNQVVNRAAMGALMSQILVMGRSQRGIDGELGIIGNDDDGDGSADLADIGGVSTRYQQIPVWDAPLGAPAGFGRFDYDDNGNGVVDDPGEYRAPGSDDGPYASVGDVAHALLHPYVVDFLGYRTNTQPFDQIIASMRPGGWTALPNPPEWDESDMHIMMGRIMNLITIESNEFTGVSRGRLFDNLTNDLLAEQAIEEDLGN
jgi:hypothetical protein